MIYVSNENRFSFDVLEIFLFSFLPKMSARMLKMGVKASANAVSMGLSEAINTIKHSEGEIESVDVKPPVDYTKLRSDCNLVTQVSSLFLPA